MIELTELQKLVFNELKKSVRSAYRLSIDLGMTPQSVGVVLKSLEKKGYISVPSYMGKKIFSKAKVICQEEN